MTEMTWNHRWAQPATADDITTRLRAGDREAMAELFSRHAEAIYNYCFRRTADWDAADDLTSKVFLIAWRSRRRARHHEDSLAPWLYGIASNVCRSHLRQRMRGRRAMQRLTNEVATQTSSDHSQQVIDAERVRAALTKLASLPPGHQEVFHLVCWEGLDYAACAAALGIPIGTVRSRLSRARAELRLNDLTDEPHHKDLP